MKTINKSNLSLSRICFGCLFTILAGSAAISETEKCKALSVPNGGWLLEKYATDCGFSGGGGVYFCMGTCTWRKHTLGSTCYSLGGLGLTGTDVTVQVPIYQTVIKCELDYNLNCACAPIPPNAGWTIVGYTSVPSCHTVLCATTVGGS